MTSNLRPLKIVIVGDGMVGKTCLLITYTRNEFPQEYVPTVFENHQCNISVDGKNFALTLWDTAGQEDYERLRTLSYPKTDCFLICYSISSKTSFANVVSMWVPEVRHHAPNVPIILVGTKSDLRIPNSEKFVTFQEGKKLKQKIKAFSLIECSALKKICLEDVFHEAIRAAVKKSSATQRTCTIL